MACLDLGVTVDTSPAHLAGATGKPVWLLLPRVPDWRWGNAWVAAAWYLQLHTFRQETLGDRNPMPRQVAEVLAAVSASR
jgi:ADP-heptose:LPS heptosyltransferase